MEDRERTLDIVWTQVVAWSLASKRNHVSYVLPGMTCAVSIP